MGSETSPIPQDHQALLDRVRNEAVVIDYTTGYIDAGFMNKEGKIDPRALATQAEIILHYFRGLAPTRIIGIPQSGHPLAKEIHRRLPHSQYVESTKNDAVARLWTNPTVIEVYSFTKREHVYMTMEHIDPGERYLIIDDVVAHGNVAIPFIKAIQQRGGLVVGLGVGFDKEFQGTGNRQHFHKGIQRIIDTVHIPVVSVVSIVDMIQVGMEDSGKLVYAVGQTTFRGLQQERPVGNI